MIEKITKDKENELINTFKDVFEKTNLKNDINNNPFSNYYLYIIDNKTVGFIHYDIIYERAELIQINVLKEYENNHIASKLIEYMITDCKNNKIENITLEVKETNERAIHIYKKYGFIEVAKRKGYYEGIDGILMEKEMI